MIYKHPHATDMQEKHFGHLTDEDANPEIQVTELYTVVGFTTGPKVLAKSEQPQRPLPG